MEAFKHITLAIRILLSFTLAMFIISCGGGKSADGGTNPPISNVAPTVSALSDLALDEQASYTVTVTASDSDGSIASYAWTQISGDTLILTNTNTATVNITTPDITDDGNGELQIAITDNDGAITTTTVNFTIATQNNSVSTEIEPNNVKEQANLLTVGETISGSINSNSDVDWFSIYSDGGTYTVNTSVDGEYRESSGMKWVITVYDENSNEIFAFNVDQEHPVPVDIELANGTYYISVNHPFDHSSNNDPYFLTVTESTNNSISTEVEPNNVKEQANLLTVGETISGSINSNGDVDWFSIYSDGGTYTVNTSVDGEYRESSGMKWVITVYDENSNEIFAFNVDQEHPVPVDIELANGTYYISVNHPFDHSSNNDPYFLTVTESTNNSISTEVEPNNVKEQANLLTVGETISGSINSNSDVDWFSIYSDGGTYTVNTSVDGEYRESSGMKWVITVYDENSNEIFAFNVDQEHPVPVDIELANGTYYISVNHPFDHSSNNDPYFLTVTESTNNSISTEVEPNNVKEQANLLTVGETMSGSINSNGDVDWFSIYSDGGTYTVNTSVDGKYRESSGIKWVITVYDENSNEIFAFNVDQEKAISVGVELANGTYYISVNHPFDHSSNNDPYSITVTI